MKELAEFFGVNYRKDFLKECTQNIESSQLCGIITKMNLLFKGDAVMKKTLRKKFVIFAMSAVTTPTREFPKVCVNL